MSRLLVAQRALTVPGWAKDALWRRAQAIPSLDLRFADSKSLVDATTGSNLVTFTRASSGTFVGSDGLIQSASTDVPRFDHNPTTGESLGLLVEEQRTNLVLRSEEFDSGSWTKIAATVTADAIVSPSGALNADKLVETTANSTHYAVQSVSVTTTSRTASIYLKAGERIQVRIEHSGNTGGAARRITINLSTGAITGAVTIGTGGLNSFSESIVSVGNGWYRIISTIDPTVTLGNTQALVIQILDNTGQATYTGDGTSGIYLWGAQLEAGAFPTSYIPTTTATVTRSADVCSISGSNFSAWYRQNEGTVFGAGQVNGGNLNCLASFDDNTTNNRWQIRRGGTSMLFRYVSSGGGIDAALLSGEALGPNRMASAIRTLDQQASNNGLLFTSITPVANTPVVDRLQIGNGPGSNNFNGTIRRLVYWGQRLPNNVLQTLTQ